MPISTIGANSLQQAQILTRPQMPAGSVLQVVATNFTNQATSSSATPANVTGFSASITPTSVNSTILVTVSVAFGFANDAYPYVLLTRNGTSVGVGSSATNTQINVFLAGTGTNAAASTPWRYHQASRQYLDSPATTSALTYQIQLACPYGGNGYINRQDQTQNATYIQFPASSITLMEIAG
jgi:hypothetical protein